MPSLVALMKEIYEEEGIVGFYKGFVATMLNTFSMRKFLHSCTCHCSRLSSEYAYFFFYSLVRTSYIKRLNSRLPKGAKAPPLSTAAELLLGAAAGALAQIFTLPVATIATRQQIGDSLDDEGHPRHPHRAGSTTHNGDVEKLAPLTEPAASAKARDDSFLGVAREIYREEGPTGYWLGLGPSMVLTVNPAITYGVFERVKSAVLLAQEKAGTALASGKLSPRHTFYVGSLSKILATIVRGMRVRASANADAAIDNVPVYYDEDPYPGAVGGHGRGGGRGQGEAGARRVPPQEHEARWCAAYSCPCVQRGWHSRLVPGMHRGSRLRIPMLIASAPGFGCAAVEGGLGPDAAVPVQGPVRALGTAHHLPPAETAPEGLNNSLPSCILPVYSFGIRNVALH